ncbi:MAG TPA: DUF4157 domain-containing protein [Actinomycetota bacterium]|nr:DUF4157 domain-containing protein [Actinomycetota bacterium]
MTAGPATRRALGAARVPAAASHGVVHLPSAPDRTPRGLGLLAHELSHVADQDHRPRMFGEEFLDAAEQRARGIGGAVDSAARGTARGAERAARGAVGAGERLLERSPISSLPVGGVMPAAVRAVEGLMSEAGGAAGGATQTAEAYVDRGRTAAGGAADELAGAVRGGLARAEGFGRGAVGSAEAEAGALRDRAEGAIGPARSAAGAAAGQAMAALDQGGQVDAMIEAIEQRLLAELERRGGRFQGLF